MTDKASIKKVVLITGASSGIGEALAHLYLLKGYRTCLVARNIEKLQAIKANANATELNCLTLKADLTQEQECLEVVRHTIEHFGQIDQLISNAGISMRADFIDVKQEVLQEVMDINYWATVNLSRAALSSIIKTQGSIVGISSIGGYIPMPGRSAYCASKAAMNSFLEVLRLEHKKDGVHVMVVSPGFTKTNIRKNARLADGNLQGDSPRDEEKMMDPAEVGLLVYDGIKNKKRQLILTNLGRFAILFKRTFPSLADKYFLHFKSQEDSLKHK